jgi:hypothetical protein
LSRELETDIELVADIQLETDIELVADMRLVPHQHSHLLPSRQFDPEFALLRSLAGSEASLEANLIKNVFSGKNLNIKFTNDGSPTFSHGLEPMHNTQGALSETNYVYGFALDLWLRSGKTNPHCVVVGTGVCYVDLLIFWVLSCGGTITNSPENGSPHCSETPLLTSFEADNFLRCQAQSFWKESADNADSSLHPLLNMFWKALPNALLKVRGLPEITRADRFLHWVRQRAPWNLLGQLELDTWRSNSTLTKRGWDLFCFDAYSQHTSPELWEESLLEELLERANDGAVFASYAATSKLKTCLRKSGFEVPHRPGFAGKRECTLAIKVLT